MGDDNCFIIIGGDDSNNLVPEWKQTILHRKDMVKLKKNEILYISLYKYEILHNINMFKN